MIARRSLAASVGGLFVALAIVLAAILRVIYGGQSFVAFVAVVVIGFAVVCVIIAYAYLRYRNVALYLRADRIGLTDAFGFHHELPVRDVSHLMKTSEISRRGDKPVAVLAVIDKNQRTALRVRGADGLDPSGISRLAAESGVPIRGSW